MPLIFEIKDNIGVITLNRPDKYNSVTKELAEKFHTALDSCSEDENVRAVFITGIGKAFCAGQDLGEITDPNGPPMSSIVSGHYNPIISKIRWLRKPVVAAVNGVAAGAGANIALACDIVVATESASFIQAFSKIGLIPDSGGTFFLPRIIGFQKASALIMLGDKVSAKEAESMNMIYKYFSDDSFHEEAWKLAQTLAAMPTKAFWLTKEALNHSYSNNIDQQLSLEDSLQTTASETDDYKEGVSAFMEKRKPVFEGK
jgi:2-(1,2-epoxy-1,2-dihydrophenyl)acetyl-CoA isomerase